MLASRTPSFGRGIYDEHTGDSDLAAAPRGESAGACLVKAVDVKVTSSTLSFEITGKSRTGSLSTNVAAVDERQRALVEQIFITRVRHSVEQYMHPAARAPL